VNAARGDHRFLARLVSGGQLVIAHRGDSFHAPENTLEAARRAYESGADAWELDVHLSRDGVPVVIHDGSLRRTTDVGRKFPNDPRRESGYLVADFDLEEIRTLDAGSWFLDPGSPLRSAAVFGTLHRISQSDRAQFTSGQVAIPTLAEALELTARLDWLVNVELKSVPTANPRLAESAMAVIRNLGVAERVLISSFDHVDVARIVARAPKVATAVLTATPLYRPAEYVRTWVGADAYHPSAEAIGACSEAYRRSPSAGTLRIDHLRALAATRVPVCVFTVNDHRPGGLSDHLKEAGVAAVFTDDPSTIRRRWGAG
jgi:glycerophosphoryl diester phosphodiesterase